MNSLWEILVPVVMGGTNEKIDKKHHAKWDKYVRKLSGGLTILKPTKGSWVCPHSRKLYEERMIPVRVACTRSDIEKIITFTIDHYNQLAVMAYKVSDEVLIVEAKDETLARRKTHRRKKSKES